ncbi:hypothetical protein K0U00_17620, partial [Paenibacillus sepulcri]|nr:hypothetical protein [Paenibacillus sepulcri]
MNPMNHTSSCKGCSDHYKVTEEQINRILSSNLVKNGSCVPDELYERRLGACRECARLLDGTTCMLCGCIVR